MLYWMTIKLCSRLILWFFTHKCFEPFNLKCVCNLNLIASRICVLGPIIKITSVDKTLKNVHNLAVAPLKIKSIKIKVHI